MCRADVLPPQWTTTSPRIASVQWRSNGNPVSWPVTDINGFNPLTLTFDFLEPGNGAEESAPWLRASLEHRDANWNRENLADSEFARGFNITDIGQGEPSVGGITTLYRHFEMEVPPRDIAPYISGNYLLKIFADSNPDSILLTVPFMIEEQAANIRANVSVVTDIDYKSKHQQLTVEVQPINIDQRVRPQELNVYAGQNFLNATWRPLGFPTRIVDNKALFEHKNELIFPAGNEYRRMETVDNNVPMLNVDHIEWHDPFYHQILKTDERRSGSPFQFQYDNDGAFKIHEYNSSEPDYEADYNVVHFILDGEGIEPGTRIFVEGDFTARAFSPSNLMTWDKSTNTYYKSLILKQGAYDYRYITPYAKDGLFSVEGNFHETGNIYNLAAYYRLPGERFDRLAATKVVSTY